MDAEDRVESDLLLCKDPVSRKFPSSFRITGRTDFSRLNRLGRRCVAGQLVFQFSVESLSPRTGGARLGITVTRKQGCSVERNQFKRRVREIFRTSSVRLKADLDCNVRPKGRLPITFRDIQEAFVRFESFLQSRQ